MGIIIVTVAWNCYDVEIIVYLRSHLEECLIYIKYFSYMHDNSISYNSTSYTKIHIQHNMHTHKTTENYQHILLLSLTLLLNKMSCYIV